MKTSLNLLRAVAAGAAVWSVGCAALAANGTSKMTNQCLTVQANQPWAPTGIVVDPTRFVCVAGSGLWSHGGQGVEAIVPYYGPEGYGRDTTTQYPDEALHIGALVARIGANFPFLVRHQICFIPRTTGELLLSMNDQPGTFGNNSGNLQVQVVTWPVAAMPKRVALAPQRCPVK